MSSYLLILLLILLHTMQSFLCKKYTTVYPGEASMASPVFTVVSGIIIAVVSMAFSSFRLSVQPLTVAFAFANALALYMYNYSIVKAAQNGVYSVQMVFSLGGSIIIPAVVANGVFDDPLGYRKIISIIIIIAAIYMTSIKKEESGQKVTRIFLIACILLFVSNGVYGSLFDAQQRVTGSGDKEEMIAITYICSSLLSLITMAVKNPKKIVPAMKQSRTSLVFLLGCSFVTALAVNLLTIILPLVDLTMFYTMDNAGVLLLSVLCSCVFFKEKLSGINIAGCVLMTVGLVGISLAA